MRINIDNINQGLAAVEEISANMDISGVLKSIPTSQIIYNPNNTAAKNDTEDSVNELADSIATGGLINPLTVNQIAPDKYMLLSGERRYRAITTHLHWDNIPCNVYSNLSADMVTIVTVFANMQVRNYSVADKLELYEQLDAALRNLKNQGKYKGGIGRGIAKMLNVSERQVSAYKKIVENTTPTERAEITNIEKTVDNIRRAEKAQNEKTYGDRKFFESDAADNQPKKAPTSYDKASKSMRTVSKICNNQINDCTLFDAADRAQLAKAKEIFDTIIQKYDL